MEFFLKRKKDMIYTDLIVTLLSTQPPLTCWYIYNYIHTFTSTCSMKILIWKINISV